MSERISRVSAYGVILEGERILLCRVSKQLPEWMGYWTLPGGGIEFGESPEAAMIREVKEETGFDVAAGRVAHVDSIVGQVDVRPFHGVRIIYRATIIGGALTDELSGSTDQCQWHSLNDTADLKLVELARIGVGIARSGAP